MQSDVEIREKEEEDGGKREIEDENADMKAHSRNSQRRCGNCYLMATREKPLKHCSRCKATQYCSKDCQAAHWKKHKLVCTMNAAHTAQLAEIDEYCKSLPPGATTSVPVAPSNMSWLELDQKLEKWVKFHRNTLMAATIHALELPIHFSRVRTHIVRVQIRYREDNERKVGMYFRLLDVQVITQQEARNIDSAWNVSIEQLRAMREDSEKANRGTIIAVGIECPPLAVQIVPFGSMKQPTISKLELQENWMVTLKEYIEEGKKFL